MAKKKENLKEMKLEDLKSKLSSLEKQILDLKFKAQGAKSKNVKEALNLRKEVARVLTEINKKK